MLLSPAASETFRCKQYGYTIPGRLLYLHLQTLPSFQRCKGEATPNTEMTLIVDVDLNLLKELHHNGAVQTLKDRRKDLYDVTIKKKRKFIIKIPLLLKQRYITKALPYIYDRAFIYYLNRLISFSF